jgi:hypothetical protein
MATEPPKQRKRARALPVPNALAFSVEDAQAMSGLGKTTIYELMNTGRLKGFRVDGRRLIVGDSLRALLGVNKEKAA